MPDHGQERRVAVGGDIGLFLAPIDNHTYFNYTSYDQDALRMARIRLFGEWHLHQGLSLVGELRTENTDSIDAAALYLRWRPQRSQALSIQVGRIPPVIGAFARRAYGHDNTVLGMPLAYQYLTSLRPDAVPATTEELLRMRGRGWQPSYSIGSSEVRTGVPLLSAVNWDTGVEATWAKRWMEVSGAISQGSPAVPVVRETNQSLMWSGRLAAQLPHSLIVGVSAARAGWLEDSVLGVLPEGHDTPSTQTLFGTDVEFGVGRWLVRGEWLRSTFDLPIPEDPAPNHELTTSSGFIEGRYRPHPRVQIGLRLDRQGFNHITDPVSGVTGTWDANVDRVEAMLGVRVTRTLDLRAGWQQNWRAGTRAPRRGIPAVGLLYWF
jgi:hypothetical protein